MTNWWVVDPMRSMYGIFTYIYHTDQPNVGIYTIHGWYGDVSLPKDYVRFHVSFLEGGITVYSTDLVSLIDKAA